MKFVSKQKDRCVDGKVDDNAGGRGVRDVLKVVELLRNLNTPAALYVQNKS